MSKTTINTVLEKFKKVDDGPLDRKEKGEDEQRFIDKHIDNVMTHDAVGKDEHDKIHAAADLHSRKPNHGNNPGEAADTYEEYEYDEIDLGEMTLEESIDNMFDLIETVIEEFLEEEADTDEAAILREMLSTEEGYEEFLDILFEEKCKECGCEECECEGDDEVIDDAPKIKKEKGKKEDVVESIERHADVKMVKAKTPDGKVVWRKQRSETEVSKKTD